MKPPKIEVADPFRKEIDSFHALAPLLLPEQVNTERLRGIDEYEDYVMLTYSLAKPLGITKMMDDMEDLMGLNILYYLRPFSGLHSEGHQCCAYATPTCGQMYKFNAQTRKDGLVHTLYVYIFTSLEIMLECLKDDLLAHEGKGVFQTKVTYPRLIADFM